MGKITEIRQKTRELQGGPPGDLPCRYCGAPTPWETLSNIGSRCQRCYDAYRSMSVAQFNGTFKRGEPKLALPRRPGRVLLPSSTSLADALPDSMKPGAMPDGRPEPPAS